MKAKVIQIGNSRGVRIPKGMLQEIGQPEEVYLEASKGTIVIRPSRSPREQWSEEFRRMAERGDDRLIDQEALSTSTWDRKEWEWK